MVSRSASSSSFLPTSAFYLFFPTMRWSPLTIVLPFLLFTTSIIAYPVSTEDPAEVMFFMHQMCHYCCRDEYLTSLRWSSSDQNPAIQTGIHSSHTQENPSQKMRWVDTYLSCLFCSHARLCRRRRFPRRKAPAKAPT